MGSASASSYSLNSGSDVAELYLSSHKPFESESFKFF